LPKYDYVEIGHVDDNTLEISKYSRLPQKRFKIYQDWGKISQKLTILTVKILALFRVGHGPLYVA
jgi:hypothetical protein